MPGPIAILGIESSCDDTAAAIWKDGSVLSNVTASQEVHRDYGGVVPELASRQHQIHIVPTVDAAIRKADITRNEITAVAFTRGPGLMGSLLVGVSFAKALALGLGIPLIEVHHMQAHVLAHFAAPPYPVFPFLCLTVSGGHTQIVLVRHYLDMEVIGTTLDDAAGEAFDKTGKMLGLPYPAGPEVDRLAQTGQAVFPFPIPQIPALDFSFSGLKTSILYFLQEKERTEPGFVGRHLADICASVQARIVSILLLKLEKAALQTGIREIAVAGGVSANQGLRQALKDTAQKRGWTVHIPPLEFCTDNAAMIAVTGYYKYLAGQFSNQDVFPEARMVF